MIEILLYKIAKSLDKKHIPYMIIGGQAVLLYGEIRLTKDIDITLGIDTDEIAAVETLCRELKLKALSENPREFAAKTMVLPAQDPKTKIRIDFIFSFSSYERQALQRSKKVKIKNYPVAFSSLEDLIIHKIFSGRAIDLEDVKNVMVKTGLKNIDVSYIKNWLKKFQETTSENLIEIFERTIAEMRR